MRLSQKSAQVPDQDAFLLCVPSGWETYISREFHELQEGLVAHGWTKLVIGETDDTTILKAIRHARVVLLWEAYELLEHNAVELRNIAASVKEQTRIAFCDDVHYFTAHRRQQRLRAFVWADRILATYPDKLQEWYPEIPEHKIRWTPHAAASYFEPGLSRSSDRVLLSGSRTWPYPFRQFCHAKLPSSVCEVVDHPGYPGYPGDQANNMQADPSALRSLGGKAYAELLRNHPAMLVCGSIFGYLVAKVFEGMATGCLVICERKSLAAGLTALGFVEGEHYVETDVLHVIEDTARLKDALLCNDPHLVRVVANAQRKVFAEHTTAARAVQIHRICNESIRHISREQR